MKKTFSLFIALLLILSLCSCSKTPQTFSYTENDTGITVTSYTGTEKDVTVPKKIDGKSVTAIGNNAFSASLAENVTVPEGISLLPYAFASSQVLESVTLDDTINEIPDGCFSDCKKLTTINANGVQKVGFDAFKETPFIKSNDFVTIGDGLLIAWNGVGNNVSVPDTVKNIGLAFSGNTNLKSIFIPETVTQINDYAFKGCIALSDISFPATITSVGTAAFNQCYKLEIIDIPAGCQAIGDLAFWDCISLRSITIPDSVTKIGKDILLGAKNVVVTTPFESTAFIYAAENNIPIE